ncbi:cyclic nucleotide-binding domain-containing protein [Mycobacterium intracellulare]|uniref:cyclic nucleotide-binding domain-containing protein n=1 Tax=Mycobacterium intracellulare TaxID=1767 RepID=UPI001CDA031D|nr:cyclic nucleotide-binding domain-containing protein [Mycobacterium intracellulare]MCA2321637.1 cyclic nucleotide-binding domain-containing protein [Mycobacterium intracellulare]MCA2343996.1 cyclic nucleotide-binding domain-containing protein [Mycobacterium intracellulare]MDV6984953.1 cyclic nucleotide-binding domain-containing protein [Mycobacterium intracellulare]MDV7031093.1 cyclic nucleotide-binding domain-containing protein [Mycobacterium intracellulare]
MINDAIAPVASAVLIASTVFWRSANRRRYVADTEGGTPAKALQAPALRPPSASQSSCRTSSARDRKAELGAIEQDRLIENSRSGGRPGGPGSWDVYRAFLASGIFSKIDPHRVSAVSETLETLQFSPGDFIDAQNAWGDRVYVIISGKVMVVHRRDDGSEMGLAILGPNEMFGAIKLSIRLHAKSRRPLLPRLWQYRLNVISFWLGSASAQHSAIKFCACSHGG